MRRRAQVDWDDDHHLFCQRVVLEQVSAQGRGDRGQHQIVDGAAGRRARDLDCLDWHRPGRGPPLARHQRALQQVAACGWPEAELAQHGRIGAGEASQSGCLAGVSERGAHHRAEITGSRPRTPRCCYRPPARSGQQRRPGGVIVHRQHTRVLTGVQRIGQRQQDLDKGSAVGDGVVGAQQQGAAIAVAVEQVQFPQRPVLPQRPPRQVAGGSLQCPLVPRRRQPRPAHVVRQREASVIDPLGRRPRSERERRVCGTLPEPAEPADHALLERLQNRRLINRHVEPQHSVDHHQVRRAVHVQPRHVRRVHLLGPDPADCHRPPSQHRFRGNVRTPAAIGSPARPYRTFPATAGPSGAIGLPPTGRSLPAPGLHQPGCRGGWRRHDRADAQPPPLPAGASPFSAVLPEMVRLPPEAWVISTRRA
jgi:hypothetical protein